MHGHCAIYAPHRPLPFMSYTIRYWRWPYRVQVKDNLHPAPGCIRVGAPGTRPPKFGNTPYTFYSINYSSLDTSPLNPVTGSLDVPYPIPSYPPGQGMGYAKGYVPGYGVKHTLHHSLVLVFYERTFHHTLDPGYGSLAAGTYPHTRVHTRVENIRDGKRTWEGLPVRPTNKRPSKRHSAQRHRVLCTVSG